MYTKAIDIVLDENEKKEVREALDISIDKIEITVKYNFVYGIQTRFDKEDDDVIIEKIIFFSEKEEKVFKFIYSTEIEEFIKAECIRDFRETYKVEL